MSRNLRDKTFEERKAESQNMLTKYPTRVCIYIEKARKSQLPEIDKQKFLVPKDLTVGQLIHVIRKRLTLTSTQAIFLFTESNIAPPTSSTIASLYNTEKNADGFLYLTYSTEETFG